MIKSLFLFPLQAIGAILNPVVAIVFLVIGGYGGYTLRPTIEPVIKQFEQARELQKLIPTGDSNGR